MRTIRLDLAFAWMIALVGCTGVFVGERDAAMLDASPDASVDGGPTMGPTARFVVMDQGETTRAFDASTSTAGDRPIVAYHWSFGDGVEAVGVRVTHVYEEPGCYDVGLRVTDAGGAEATASEQLAISGLPTGDPVVTLDPLPRDGALLPRDRETNEGHFTVSGTISASGWEVRARVIRDGAEERVLHTTSCGGRFALDVPIVSELARRDVEILVAAADDERSIATVHDLVAGDVLMIEGQSNAVAGWLGRPDHAMVNGQRTPFVRSFGARSVDPALALANDRWSSAEGDRGDDGDAAIGQWALHMGVLLVEATGVPLAIVSGARGGQPIEFFARDYEDPEHPTANNYEMLNDRMRRAGIERSVRAILYYQGEGDGGRVDAHRDGFTALQRAWSEDYPGVERHYVMQIRSGCGAPSVEFLDMQRRFAETLPRTTVMSTTGLDGHDGCHYIYDEGYGELGERLAALLARDLYGVAASDVEAIDVTTATLAGDVLSIATRSDATAITVDPGVAADFRVDGGRTITGVRAVDDHLELTLSGGGAVSRVTYAGHSGSGPWITNVAGVGLLAFVLPVD